MNRNFITKKHLLGTIVVAGGALILFNFIPEARAGVLSSLSSFIAKPKSSLASDLNSQTIPLAGSGFVANNATGVASADITVVADSALVPETGPLGTAADVAEIPEHADHISVHVVHAGDTLAEIAAMFDVSVNTIVWANDLDRTKGLKEGQVLVILPISGVRHIVAKNDTIASIAKKYKGDAEEIAQFNNLEVSAKLILGTELIIPNGEITPVAKPKTSKTAIAGSGVRGEVRIASPDKLIYSGYYLRPVKGGMKTQGIHGQNGVDLAHKVGVDIYAAADGEVIVAKTGGWNGGYGNYIVIKHPNGTQTLYAHLLDVIVSTGDTVKQGQVIGHLGSSGRSTGPHIHFEIRGATNPF